MSGGWQWGWSSVEAIGTSAAALLTVVLLLLTWRTLSQVRKQADSAQDQLKTMQGQLESTQLQVLVAFEQVQADVLTRRADHERRQKEATFTFWDDVQTA